ncbi:fasciclin domain containing protein [Nitzschia inconspicua]|uniref:Fasciclin domain containing protein n=1 Tax=Nitzschia inconspicua TaxID=303405 RepID=A0A9K3LLW1_9STRA|nr:fasciclin domain containing protein [Nitzschia inconspicua]
MSCIRLLNSIFILLLAVLIVSPCDAQTNAASTNQVTINNDQRLKQFSGFLTKAGINPSTALTMFAPTNEAFEKFQASDPVRYEKWTQQSLYFVHLKKVLEWHLVTEGAYTFDQIFDGSRTLMENAQGNITIDQRFKRIDNVDSQDFVQSDIATAEGVLHALGSVIIPPYLAVDLITTLLKDRSYVFALSNMANLALHAGLEDRLNDDYEKGLTFLVPPNRRFNRAEIDIPKMLTDEMYNYTRDFILCHMIKDIYHEAQVFARNNANNEDQFLVISELGTHMWITTTEDRLRFQSVNVLVPDIPSNNGVFHIIDYPLFPPSITDFAFFTPLSTNHDTSDCFRLFRQCILSSSDIADMFNTTLTTFCPTREAFAFFNNEDFQRLLEPVWYRHACEFLFNHMTSPAQTREELVARAPDHITMLNGATYQLRKSGDTVRLKNGNEEARSQFGDLIALDGYLHTLDAVITPTAVSQSIYDRSRQNPEFSLLVENIDFVDLTDLVDRDLPLTVLAPDNRAFRRIEFGTLEGGEIIKRHIFKGLFFCDVLANMTTVTTVDGLTHAIELRGDNSESLWVGGARVYECDILARNGVLHYIDRVIGMDYETVPPTISPAPTITPNPTTSYAPTGAPIPLFADVPDSNAVPIFLPPVRPPSQPTATDNSPDALEGSSSGVVTLHASRILFIIGSIAYMIASLL